MSRRDRLCLNCKDYTPNRFYCHWCWRMLVQSGVLMLLLDRLMQWWGY